MRMGFGIYKEDNVGPLSAAAEVVVTFSQRGHIVRVDAGRGWQPWGDITVGGPTFMALSSSTSLCSLLFCSVNDPNHLFRYSHSISVCFSLLLHLSTYTRLVVLFYIVRYVGRNFSFEYTNIQ